MATDTSDILDRTSLRNSQGNGVRYIEVWKHSGVTGADTLARFLNADSRTPSLGTYKSGTQFRLIDKSVTPDSKDRFTTTLTYSNRNRDGDLTPQTPDDPPQYEVFGTLETVRTNTDKDGNKIVVTVPAGQAGKDITPLVDVQLPRFGFRVTRVEASRPDNAARRFVGKVNSTPFAGQPAGEWLMGPIRGRSDDGGDTYRVTYDLFYNPEDWTSKLRWEDGDGRFYDPVVVVEMYNGENFNDLGLI